MSTDSHKIEQFITQTKGDGEPFRLTSIVLSLAAATHCAKVFGLAAGTGEYPARGISGAAWGDDEGETEVGGTKPIV